MARTQGRGDGAIHSLSKRCPSHGAPAMTRKSRFFVFIAAVTLPMVAACGESTTGPELVSPRKMSAEELQTLTAMGCGESIPWGFAGCVAGGK